jgi:hypothetical protein
MEESKDVPWWTEREQEQASQELHFLKQYDQEANEYRDIRWMYFRREVLDKYRNNDLCDIGSEHIIFLQQDKKTPDYNEMLSVAYGLMSKYDVDRVYMDGANPSFIKSLKLQIGEDADYMPEIHKAKQENRKPDMRIVPVNFNAEHKAMLGHCKMILEQDPGKIAINPDKFDKLITALRTAVDNDGTLDKEATSYNDIFAFRLALKFYHFQERTD